MSVNEDSRELFIMFGPKTKFKKELLKNVAAYKVKSKIYENLWSPTYNQKFKKPFQNCAL